MIENNELEKIKKMYGEDFMELCGKLFPTVLEKEGELYEILSHSFAANSKTLCEDIIKYELEEQFKNYIFNMKNVDFDISKNKDETPVMEIPSYVIAEDGKSYKYNMYTKGKYYCPRKYNNRKWNSS